MAKKSGGSGAHAVTQEALQYVELGEGRAFVERRRDTPRRMADQAVDTERRRLDQQRRSGNEQRLFATDLELIALAGAGVTGEQAQHFASQVQEWATALITAINALRPPTQGAKPTGVPSKQGAVTMHDVLASRPGYVAPFATPVFRDWKDDARAPRIIELRGLVPRDHGPGTLIPGLSALVKDLNDRAVGRDVRVTFAVSAGGGTLTIGATQDVEAVEARTGADGVALLDSWKLGPKAGLNVVTVTVGGVTKDFTTTSK